jgi:hypothetical protein
MAISRFEVGNFEEQRLEPPAGKAAERGGHQCFGVVSISLIMNQSEKIPGKKKSCDLPSSVTQELIELHCARGDRLNVFRGVSLIEYRAMRLDIDGAHDCCEVLLFLGSQ